MENYYKMIIKDSEFDQYHKNLATILIAMNSNKMSTSDKLKLLEPVVSSPNELEQLASELEVLYLLNLKNKKLGLKKLELLLDVQILI